jgi:hypothetical protein
MALKIAVLAVCGENAAGEVAGAGKTPGPHHRDGLRASRAGAAVDHDLLGRIEVGKLRGELRHRHEHGPRNPADRHFVGLAHVDDDRRLPCIHASLQLTHRHVLSIHRVLCLRPRGCAVFLVLAQLSN